MWYINILFVVRMCWNILDVVTLDLNLDLLTFQSKNAGLLFSKLNLSPWNTIHIIITVFIISSKASFIFIESFSLTETRHQANRWNILFSIQYSPTYLCCSLMNILYFWYIYFLDNEILSSKSTHECDSLCAMQLSGNSIAAKSFKNTLRT